MVRVRDVIPRISLPVPAAVRALKGLGRWWGRRRARARARRRIRLRARDLERRWVIRKEEGTVRFETLSEWTIAFLVVAGVIGAAMIVGCETKTHDEETPLAYERVDTGSGCREVTSGKYVTKALCGGL